MIIIFFQPIAGGHVAIQIILQHDNDMTACSASQNKNKNRRLLRRWSLSLSQKMYAWKIRVEVFIINFLY